MFGSGGFVGDNNNIGLFAHQPAEEKSNIIVLLRGRV